MMSDGMKVGKIKEYLQEQKSKWKTILNEGYKDDTGDSLETVARTRMTFALEVLAYIGDLEEKDD